jgi:hypothetical protein
MHAKEGFFMDHTGAFYDIGPKLEENVQKFIKLTDKRQT